MRLNFNTYVPGASVIHLCDARVKLAVLFAYSVTLFFVQTWTGLLLCAAAYFGASLVAKLSPRRMFVLLIPLYVILAFTLVFNGFSFDVFQDPTLYGFGYVSAGVFAGWEPVPLIGSFGFMPEGFMRGCYYALRICLLVLASFIVTFTTTSTELINALYDFLKPLRVFRVPTEDIAMMVSVALRFIPLTAEELFRIKDAQQSRGAVFDEGGLVKRIAAWQPVLIPLFVGLFRRAGNLSLAMESRCYGMASTRTRLDPRPFTPGSWMVLGGGLVLCVAVAVVL